MGWLSRDLDSNQHKLNRTGAYFEINLEWNMPKSIQNQSKTASKEMKSQRDVAMPPCSTMATSDSSLVAALLNDLVNRAIAKTEFAPPNRSSLSEFAPPKERPEPPQRGGIKNQNLTPLSRTGDQDCQENLPDPLIHNLRSEDFHNIVRLEALYIRAIRAGWLSHTETNIINWVAAAIRARSIKQRDPVRGFRAIVTRSLWRHITQAQEDKALKVLKRVWEKRPKLFRMFLLKTNSSI
jgi:hypothetical protein